MKKKHVKRLVKNARLMQRAINTHADEVADLNATIEDLARQNKRMRVMQDTWTTDALVAETAINAVKNLPPNMLVSDAVAAIDAVYAKARHPANVPPVRVIDKMELVSVSLDVHGDPHSEVRVLKTHLDPPLAEQIIATELPKGMDAPLDTEILMGKVADDANHYISITPTGWTLQHPLSCRETGVLFNCPVNKAAEAHDWSVMEVEPIPTGIYPCAATAMGWLLIDEGAPIAEVTPIKP